MKIYNDYGINHLLTEDAWIMSRPASRIASILFISFTTWCKIFLVF